MGTKIVATTKLYVYAKPTTGLKLNPVRTSTELARATGLPVLGLANLGSWTSRKKSQGYFNTTDVGIEKQLAILTRVSSKLILTCFRVLTCKYESIKTGVAVPTQTSARSTKPAPVNPGLARRSPTPQFLKCC